MYYYIKCLYNTYVISLFNFLLIENILVTFVTTKIVYNGKQ